MNKLLKRWFLAIFYEKIYKKSAQKGIKRAENGLKLIKNSQKYAIYTKNI